MRRGGILDKGLRAGYRRVFQTTASPLPRVESIDRVAKLTDSIIQLGALDYRWGDLNSLQSLTLLCRLARSGYAPVFEFGTFRGRTTFNIALNLPPGGQIVTLDAHYVDDSKSNTAGISYPEYETGEVFLNTDPATRDKITILRGDSTNIDLTEHFGRFGLVFVDGGHSYEVCLNDSILALKLCRPGGLILWDDYTDYWPGTKRAIEEFHRHHQGVHYVASHDAVVCKTPS